MTHATRLTLWAGFVIGAAVVGGAAARAEDSIAVLRSGPRVEVTEISRAGALASSKVTGVRRLSLSGVRSVEGPLAAHFREHEDFATRLWRAGVRLDRGDVPGAEPIYEALWAMTKEVSGPTRAEIAAGLVACRVRRGAFAAAIEPWAAWLSESGELVSTDAERCLSRLATGEGMDASAQWLVGLPPVFVDGPLVRAFAAGEMGGGAKEESSVEVRGGESSGRPDVLTIYRYAAKRDTGGSREDAAAFEKAKGWDNIAGDMVLAESGDSGVRERARGRLRDRAGGDAPAWQSQWARLGLGRSLRLESGSEAKTQAVLELLWVASREVVAQEVLCQALAAAAETLVELDDRAGAARVLSDLESRLADHSILGSARLSRLRAELGMQVMRSMTGTSGQRPSGAAEKDAAK